MGKQTFTRCLLNEMESARYALLEMLLKKDALLYEKAPALRGEYMDCIGTLEQQVLEAELETTLLQKKLGLIQAKVNRREVIALDAIEEQLAKERRDMIAKVEQSDLTRDELPQLTQEERETLQEDYQTIVRMFHPQTHTDLTDTQRDLYEKACDAYRRQDLYSMSIIRDALLPSNKMIQGIVNAMASTPTSKEDLLAAEQEALYEHSTDYTLAARLFNSYEPSPEEHVLLDKAERFRAQLAEIEQEIIAIKAAFPFNAEETLRDTQKRQAYILELKHRMYQCDQTQRAVKAQIDALLETANVKG